MRKVNHDNIYKMYDAFEDADHLYLIVELLSGPNINKVFKFFIYFEFLGMVR